ncbi:MAG: TIGR04222 domain-containing membrane protein [Pirellulaceae bacterium]|nr:TIGR04222 domain-containing membrane protein [Pirellulaceae bacterium]
MNASQQALLDRLLAFQFDEADAKLTFARRLARENGWSTAYAERVIVDYKKFLFLAVTAGHVVTPSEQVDQAWHLHLTYTRSYWEDMCRSMLHQPLHHGPTKGGDEEQTKFIERYNQTLASYQRLLGQEPPSDIWSPAGQRFGEDLQHVSVNTERYWIIPKPRWPLMLPRSTPLLALGLVGLPLGVAAWNPLNWTGPQFLAFYLALVIVAALLALVTRLVVAPQTTAIDFKRPAPLDPYEVACLVAGPDRAVQAAFAAMMQAGTLRLATEEVRSRGVFTKTSTKIHQGKALPKGAPPLEQALFDAAAVPAEILAPLTAAGMPVAKDINESLVERGLLQAGSASARAVAASLIMAAPLLIALPKIAVGLSRGRPVEILAFASVLTGLAALGFLLARTRLSASGRALLDSLQAKHAPPQLTESAAATFAPTELAMAIGLFGAGWLAVGPLASVHAMLPRASGGGGCSTSNGGCGASGGGGGGCGGGSCGGGGCGGCGS